MIKTKFILGEAGTAKSTLILYSIEELDDYVCLALTHSAVRNLSNKFAENHETDKEYLDDHFKTIHSFFRLKFDDEGNEIFVLNRQIDVPDYIFIDEISLVSLTIINIIYETILNNITPDRVINLILVGDLLQLNPINTFKLLIDYHKLFNVPNIKIRFQEAMLIASHLSNNIYSTNYYHDADKIVLTKNYRSNSNVIKILYSVLDNINNVNKYIIKDINKYVEKGYIILSSRYDYLKELYERINKSNYTYSIKTHIGLLYFNNNDELLLTKNLNKNFVNGDKIKIIFNDNIIRITNVRNINNNSSEDYYEFIYNQFEIYPFLPLNFLTIHKSQGLSINKVLVVLDDMFEITMLYTAITRAIEDVKFTILHKMDYKKMNLYNKSFNILKTILYS